MELCVWNIILEDQESGWLKDINEALKNAKSAIIYSDDKGGENSVKIFALVE
jgi:hypothetical protein